MKYLTTVVIWALLAASASSGELRVGAASVPITPPVGTPMAGYYSERGAQAVHDDLYAKAIVIEAGGRAAALVVLDLISTPRDLVEQARREIERTTRLRGADIMISATHTHTGPLVDRNNAFGGQSDLVGAYVSGLPAKIAEAVRRAEAQLAPARASAACGREESIAFNRRYHMKDGTVGWNPGKLNPRVIKPAGTIDPEVPLVSFESATGQPVAVYVNYAVHLDNIGEPRISADLPFTLARALADFKGPEMITVYSTGCCGDVNHIDVNWREPQRGFSNPARMGTILAAEVFRTWPRLKPVEADAVRVRTAVVPLALPTINDADIAKSRSVIARVEDSKAPRPTFLEMVDAFKTRDVAARQGRPLEVEVQVIALGHELAWVSLPGEIFTELGLAIKQDSPFHRTIIAELANGSIGYIPARRAYAQGNYEVVSARCAEGSGERLVDAALRLLKDLYADAGAGAGAAGNRPASAAAGR
jgi:neutral ceramidase